MDSIYSPESNKQFWKEKVVALEDKALNLEVQLLEKATLLETNKSRCTDMENQMQAHVLNNIALEKKITELESKCKEVTQQLGKLENEKEVLLEEKCDLEIIIAENDVHTQALQEHIEELESTYSTMRDQRDEQHNYFLQREISMKNELHEQMETIKDEKSLQSKDLAVLKTEHLLLKDDLNYIQAHQGLWNKEKEMLRQEIGELTDNCHSLKNDLEVEKETVSMLSSKNTSLAEELLTSKSQFPSSPSSLPSRHLTKETTSEIEELVEKFYQQKFKTAEQFNDDRVTSLLNQVSDYEQQLTAEKHLRQETEVKVAALEKELHKMKQEAESLLSLSIKRCRNGLNLSQKMTSNRLMVLSDISNLDATFNSTMDYRTANSSVFSLADGDSSAKNLVADTSSPSQLDFCSEKIKLANERAIAELKKLSIIK
ncbi:uncharacterized protein LOC143462890 isoform X1 [Clavelina lepadiformis]|uniref:Uncharacterized protein n=1 Tax=Clavelina lepadiformis TaxID=159417 RepID=A0ABP0GL95_CLALP